MSNNDFNPYQNIKNNFSLNANIEFDEEESEKQRQMQRTQIEPLLNIMKAKMEEGKSKYGYKFSSEYNSNQDKPNSHLGMNMNKMNINSQYSSMNINNSNLNGKTEPNFSNNNMINIKNQGNMMGMNNNAFINNQNMININNNNNDFIKSMNSNIDIEGNNIESVNNKLNNINLEDNYLNKNSNKSNQNNKILNNNIINNDNNNGDVDDSNQDNIISIDNKNEIISNSILDNNSKDSKIKAMELLTSLNKNNFDQEKLDNIRKSEIIERHSEKYSTYYDYTPGEAEGNLNELLEDINSFGEITKMSIEKDLESNPNKFIPLDDALKDGFENEFFALGLLGKVLEKQGCLVVIEKDKPETEEQIGEIYTSIQFLVNNMYNFKKFIFYFDFGEERNQALLQNEDKRNFFNHQLRKKLKLIFNLDYSDIIMTNPRKGSYQITAIIKKLNYNDYSPEKLLKELKEDFNFNNIQKVEKGILLSGCKLNPFMLDERGNNCDGGWGFNETRGNHPYYPPQGWFGYGLRVIDRYDKGNNNWIDYRNIDGEWSVAYHGVGSLLGNSEALNMINFLNMENMQTGIRQNFKESKDYYHKDQKVGEGVYVTPKPEILDKYCPIFEYDGTQYKIGFMTRVMPEKIRCPEEEKDYWVINGTDNEIRPYRILIKEIGNENKDEDEED